MNIQPGMLLQSTAALQETYFAQALIYIAQYDSEGAVGFVVNKAFGRSLHELVEFRHAGPFALQEGGPVDTEHLFILHRSPDLIAGGIPVLAGVYLGGNFSQAVAGIQQQKLTRSNLRVFVGYCGWDAGELESELAEGSWVLQPADPALVFD